MTNNIQHLGGVFGGEAHGARCAARHRGFRFSNGLSV